LVAADNTVLDEAAVLIGLGVVDAGGDFADGVIAASGVAMGADAFVSFDKKAVRLISDTGLSTRLL
jgi:predicted nucleic-acid-binding protein